MSDSRAYRIINTLAGEGYALVKAQQQCPECLLLGALGGYGSNVTLDAFTPAGLPLLVLA